MKSINETLVMINIETGEDEECVVGEPWGCPVKGSSQELPRNSIFGAMGDSVIRRVHCRRAVGTHWTHNDVQFGNVVIVVSIAETELGNEYLLSARGGQ